MASPKRRVLTRHPDAWLKKENLTNNGTYHWTVQIGDTGKSLSTPTMHGTPREAWQGAMYAINRRDAKS
jgi:hypothetical protein